MNEDLRNQVLFLLSVVSFAGGGLTLFFTVVTHFNRIRSAIEKSQEDLQDFKRHFDQRFDLMEKATAERFVAVHDRYNATAAELYRVEGMLRTEITRLEMRFEEMGKDHEARLRGLERRGRE